MKRRRGRGKRNYRRRSNSLRASNWGPVLALLGTVLGVLGLVALIVFVGLPKLLPLVGIDYTAPFAPTPTPAPTPRPTPTPNPMDLFDASAAVTEVVFDAASDYKWFSDPYFYHGDLVLAAGKLVDSKAVMLDLYLYHPESRSAEKFNLSLTNTHFLFPKFNDKWLVYLDANADGGGLLTVVDRTDASARPVVIKEIYTGQPEPMLDGDYVAWTERTGTRMDKLFLCDLNTLETVTVHMFSNNPYGQSLPSLRDGLLVWADAESSGSADSDDRSVIYQAEFNSSGKFTTYSPGGYVHDPQSNGIYTAWLDDPHGPDTNLYFQKNGGTPALIASGVVQFGLGQDFVAFSKEEAIWLYRFDNQKTYQLSGTYEKAMFLGVSDNRVIWMDVTSRERDIIKFSQVP